MALAIVWNRPFCAGATGSGPSGRSLKKKTGCSAVVRLMSCIRTPAGHDPDAASLLQSRLLGRIRFRSGIDRPPVLLHADDDPSARSRLVPRLVEPRQRRLPIVSELALRVVVMQQQRKGLAGTAR